MKDVVDQNRMPPHPQGTGHTGTGTRPARARPYTDSVLSADAERNRRLAALLRALASTHGIPHFDRPPEDPPLPVAAAHTPGTRSHPAARPPAIEPAPPAGTPPHHPPPADAMATIPLPHVHLSA